MSKHHEEGRREADEPTVLEGSTADPVFPTESEYQVDEGGARGSKSKHPGLIWVIIAAVAVIASCIIFAMAGDWMSPQEATEVQDAETNSQIVPEDEDS
ncbi:MAG: hypothetical protein HFJ65_03670 [Eggerthellaceae bacterium]|nr:hypothetical protein [Eggerthellaceae bacterium]